MAKRKFPRTLYKKADRTDDTALRWGKWRTGSPKQGGSYHSLIVVSEDELEAAFEMGYVDSLDEALFGDPKEAEDAMRDEEF